MTDQGTRPSDRVVERTRTLRTFRRLTQAETAEGITRSGFPISKVQYRHFENGRRKDIPYNFVVAAAAFFTGTSDIGYFLHGPLCTNCHDDPPRKYACMTCRRYRNDDGEVVPC